MFQRLGFIGVDVCDVRYDDQREQRRPFVNVEIMIFELEVDQKLGGSGAQRGFGGAASKFICQTHG